MKVKAFLDKFNMGSNAKVRLCDVNEDKEYRLFYDQLRYGQYYKYIGGEEKFDFSNMKLNSFTIRDNEITIYAE